MTKRLPENNWKFDFMGFDSGKMKSDEYVAGTVL